MADFPLNVLYKNGNVSYPGSAANGRIEITEPGSTITFSKATGSDAFSFTNRNTIAPVPPFAPSSVDITQALVGDQLVFTDTDLDYGTYNYCLVLNVNGTDVTTDPQIV